MGTIRSLPHYNMNYFSLLPCLLVLVSLVQAADIEVGIDLAQVEEVENQALVSDRTVVCSAFGRPRCVTACTGQLCTSNCQARCGLFRTATFLCSTINSSGCTT